MTLQRPQVEYKCILTFILPCFVLSSSRIPFHSPIWVLVTPNASQFPTKVPLRLPSRTLCTYGLILQCFLLSSLPVASSSFGLNSSFFMFHFFWDTLQPLTSLLLFPAVLLFHHVSGVISVSFLKTLCTEPSFHIFMDFSSSRS